MLTVSKLGLGGIALTVASRKCLVVKASCNPDPCEPKYVGDVIKKKVGFPQPTACCKPLRFKDFIISYDSRNRIPNWVYEHLTYDKLFKDDPCDRRVKVERQQCKRLVNRFIDIFINSCCFYSYELFLDNLHYTN